MTSNLLGLKCAKCQCDLDVRSTQVDRHMGTRMQLECQNRNCGQLYSGIAVAYPEGDEQQASRVMKHAMAEMKHRWECPQCQSRCRIRTSKKPHPNVRYVYLQCKRPECGWRGKGECIDGQDHHIKERLQ